ncbi:hypothetical protein HG263_05445 [Pseudoalteromonas sp. JBTF-M23]|uniref:Tail sheath protein subtilisin-like domain-containing protein n=1 Tax=Pseudoalteromonas caenipelagi TaxID=2726988 RepID=A0A849VB30_9GAMM|nr:phage tail sheath subtilisin-like domain-containing protein [Pseudoalteromonas caenipelagi]NOU49980.1 hypothetical protein [Pseudoalteromonas caenipelagi]
MSLQKGIEIIETISGPIPINEVASAIIAVVGTADMGDLDAIKIVRTADEAEALYGTNGTLGEAFDAIYDHVQTLTVVAIRVAEDGTESTQIANVVAGLKRIEDAYGEYGLFPKIIIAPGFSHKIGVGAEMIAIGNKIGAVSVIDAPETATPEQAVTFKGAFSDYRAIVTYPRVKTLNNAGQVVATWLSARYAALMAQVDKNQTGEPHHTGYWCSPSNYVLKGVVGVERSIQYNPRDNDNALNYLAGQGIVSVLNDGSGFRAWGNRSTAFPSKSDSLTFIPWRRTMDIIEESIQFFTRQFLDKPMFTRPNDLATSMIGQIELSVNDFLRSKVGTALVYGKCELRIEDNPLINLANGKVKYHIQATPPVPIEHVTYEAEVYVPGLEIALNQLLGG